MRVERKLPAFEGVGPGQTATLKVPIGQRFHEIALAYGGTTFSPSYMTEIRVVLNGEVFQRFSGIDRDKWNQFDDLAATAVRPILVIPFDRIGLKTMAAEVETAINTGSKNPTTGVSISSFTLEVDISATAIAPTLSATATVSDAIPGGPGSMLYIKRFDRAPAGAGDFEISDLPRGNSESLYYNRIWFKPSANNITNITVERDGYKTFDRSASLNAFIQTHGVRNPQIGYYAIDPTERGYGGEIVPIVNLNDWRITLTVDGAMSLPITVEYLGTLVD